MLIHRHRQRGFTLIELMIGIVILGVLLTQAIPMFTAWIQNTQIRSSAEAILNGLQLARTQAIRSNLNTELVLTNTDPLESNVGAVVASTGGTNWIIRNQNPINGVAFSAADFVQGRSGQEGSRNAQVLADSGTGSFVFSSLGRLLNVPAGGVVNIDVSGSTSFTGMRPMRIIVSAGGQVLMCDPAQTLAATNNPQFCP